MSAHLTTWLTCLFVGVQRLGTSLLSQWCCLLIKAGNELSHIQLCRSPHQREKESTLEAAQSSGRTHLREKRDVLIRSPARRSPDCSSAQVGPAAVRCAGWVTAAGGGRAEGGVEMIWWSTEGGGRTATEWGCWEEREKKGLKTSRRGCREKEALRKKGKERRSGEAGGECLPKSEQAVLSCSSSLCPRWLCLWPGPAVAIIRHK